MFSQLCSTVFPGVTYVSRYFSCVCLLCVQMCFQMFLIVFPGVFTCEGLPAVLPFSLFDLFPAAIVSLSAAALFLFLSDRDDLWHRHTVAHTWHTHTHSLLVVHHIFPRFSAAYEHAIEQLVDFNSQCQEWAHCDSNKSTYAFEETKRIQRCPGKINLERMRTTRKIIRVDWV